VKTLKASLIERDVDVNMLNQRFKQEADNCLNAEAALPVAQ
jgi:hypothetical protein